MEKRTATTRKEQAEETRNRIYTSAIELMEENGFGNFTIEDISKRAEVSVGAFYHYFDSKNDILADIFYRADDYISTQLINSVNNRSITERIVEYFDHYARFNVDCGVETTQQIFNPKIKFFVEKGRPMLEILENLIRKGQENNEIQGDIDAKELVGYLLIMARGIVFDWSLRDGNYDLEAKMHEYMKKLVSTIKV
jgi:AcrR family transcriptional regulator